MNDDLLTSIISGDVEAYAALVEETARRVARRLPKVDGTSWTSDDIDDLAGSFYTSPGYQHALIQAHDDESLRALVYTSIRNLQRGQLRQTERGRLLRRLRELMSEEGYVERPAKFWRRSDNAAEASAAPIPELVAAAWGVEVQLIRWRPDAKRNSPIAERKSLLAVLDAVFDAAGGAVHMDVLVEVFAQRLAIGPTAATEDLDVVDERVAVDADPGPEAQALDAEAELDSAVAALELWGQLSPGEKELLPHLGSSVRDAAEKVGRPKSTVGEAMKRLNTKMRTWLIEHDEESRERVASELLTLAADLPDTSPGSGI